MQIEEQLQRWWLSRRKSQLNANQVAQIRHWVEMARQRLCHYSSLEDCLQRHSIQWQISQSPHMVAGVRMRAQLDLNARRLTIYAGALDELQTPARPRKLVERVILSHEVFHLLCPECPAMAHEAAAHWFAGLTAGLSEFPGIWDLPPE
ncbi:hypothetical protein JST97_29050 [bacterium]|nr:hypothetical protein [bacterium]